MRLTETAIRGALRVAAETGKREELSDSVLRGLRLRLTPSGTASWVLGCRDAYGKARRFPLGRWPHMGVAEARDAARAEWLRVRSGADPIADRQRKRSEVATLNELLDGYRTANKSWPEAKKRIRHVFASLLKRPLSSVRAVDLQRVAGDHPGQYSASGAVRSLRPVLKRAAERGEIEPSVARIRPPAAVRRRERVLSREEVAILWAALKLDGRPHARAMQFMLLTLARRDEVAEARRRDVRNGVWVIPTTKSGREHRLALPRQALALLTLDGDGDTRLFPNARGGKLGNWDRETKLIREKCGLAHFTRHDLRRTGATMLGEMGVEPHIIEAALNHTSIHSSLASVYNRSRYSMPVANALEKLADILDGTAGAENVLPFGREAA